MSGMDKELGRHIKAAWKKYLSGIVEEIPVIGGIAGKIILIVQEGFENYNAEKEEAENRPPRYMDCVSFLCREGYPVGRAERED